MARSYGALKVAVWEAGSDFRNLSHLAQWAYVLLISQPQLNNLGVLPYTPNKWARFSFGMTAETFEEALDELDSLKYIVIDAESGELLVRTFIKHDKVWQQPSLVTNARKLIREVESDRIRELLTARHPWLITAESREQIEQHELTAESEEQSQEKTPPDRPVDTRRESSLGSRARAGPGPGPGPGAAAEVLESTSSTSAASYAEPNPENLEGSAAAEESPTETAIREACQRVGADMKIVEPIARQLPATIFATIETKHQAKVRRGSANDPPALFVDLLQRALADRARQQAKLTRPMPPTRLPESERAKPATGEDWVRHIVPTLSRHSFDRVEQLVTERAHTEGWTNEELELRLAIARDVHQAAAA